MPPLFQSCLRRSATPEPGWFSLGGGSNSSIEMEKHLSNLCTVWVIVGSLVIPNNNEVSGGLTSEINRDGLCTAVSSCDIHMPSCNIHRYNEFVKSTEELDTFRTGTDTEKYMLLKQKTFSSNWSFQSMRIIWHVCQVFLCLQEQRLSLSWTLSCFCLIV